MVAKKSKYLVYLIQDSLEIKSGTPVCYTGVERSSNGQSLNVNGIDTNTLNEINAFIVNLDAFFESKLFSLTSALSANRYLSPLYDNFLKGWCVLEILRKHSEIYLLVDNYHEKCLWKDFLLANNVQVISKNKSVLHCQIKSLIGEMIGILKEYFWVTCTKKKKQHFSKIIFIDWINENNKSCEQVIKESSYFGKFLKDIHEKIPVSILGNILNGHRNFRKIIRSDSHFIKEEISLWDIAWSFLKSFKLLTSIKEKIIFENYDFTSIVNRALKKDFWDTSYLKHLLFYKAFRKICLNISNNAAIVYPFENQPWEKALIMACSEQKNKINLFAYQFFPIPENFLIHRFSEKAKNYAMLPAKILTSDRHSNHFLQKEGISTLKVGSLRYNHLLNYQVNFTTRKKILCSLFLDELETISMVKKMVNISKHVDCDFIINYHPSLSTDIIGKIKNLVEDSKNITLSNMKVPDLLEDVFLLIYNSSSVFFEAALRGIAVLYLPCDDIVNLDRFHGLGKMVKSDEEAIFFIQKLRVDKNFYEAYASEVYEKSNQMIIPYHKHAIEGLNL